MCWGLLCTGYMRWELRERWRDEEIKGGGVEEWRDEGWRRSGGMKGWRRSGGVEERRSGGVEEWRDEWWRSGGMEK